MKEQKEPKLVFVRHAHRHKPHPEEDNGISEKGREQVKGLEKDYEKGRLPPAKYFWSSPKIRCQETLKPLSDLALSPLQVEKGLDEQKSNESQTEFISRIGELLKKAVALNDTVYLCSHGDVIPEAINELAGKSVNVSKGEALVVAKVGSRWDLL